MLWARQRPHVHQASCSSGQYLKTTLMSLLCLGHQSHPLEFETIFICSGNMEDAIKHVSNLTFIKHPVHQGITWKSRLCLFYV